MDLKTIESSCFRERVPGSEWTPKAFAGGAAPSWTAAASCPSSGLVCWLGCAAAVLGLSPGKGHTRAEEGRAKASSPVETAAPPPSPLDGGREGARRSVVWCLGKLELLPQASYL